MILFLLPSSLIFFLLRPQRGRLVICAFFFSSYACIQLIQFLSVSTAIYSYQTLAFKGTELRNWSSLAEDGDEPDPLALRAAAGRIIKRCGLRGAQLGVSLVFLKYFHGEKLMRLMELQEAMATRLTKVVRRFLAQRQLHYLKAAKAKEIARLAREEAGACCCSRLGRGLDTGRFLLF